MKKPKIAKDGYTDSYYSEAEIYQHMEEFEDIRNKIKKQAIKNKLKEPKEK